MYTHIFNFFEKCMIFFTIFIGTSLLVEKPSLEYVPNSSLIWYRVSQRNTTSSYITEVDKFLELYMDQEENPDNENMQDCSSANKPNEGKVCMFKLENSFAPCVKDYEYGFESEDGGPCIFLKLNKIYGWVPEYYNSSTANTTNNKMPEHLKFRIAHEEKYFNHHFVWVDCQGENPADVENIGPISYHPQNGFHDKYFPFKNIKGYLSPLVAVHFERPKRGVIISVVCKTWAPNLSTSARFQLLIDY